jgi:hypothetical protein
MKRHRLALLALTLFIAAPSASRAGVCVEIDPERDSLTDQERHGAVVLVTSLLEQKGLPATPDACDATYRIYHLIFGQAVTVVLTGPNGSRQTSVDRFEDLPAAYSQLVNALIDDVPLANSNSTVNRRNVTRSDDEPLRVDAEKVWFARLGGTGVAGAAVAHSFGFGFRYELDTVGVEVSFANVARLTADGNDGGSVAGVFKLLGQYYFDPISSSTGYLGAGCSWGSQHIVQNGDLYQGSGIQLEVVGGYEMLRASTIRLFVEAGATVPLYRAQTITYDGYFGDSMPEPNHDDFWAPSFTVSMGIGFGGRNRDDGDLR